MMVLLLLKHPVNIDSIKVKKTKGHNSIIKLDDKYSMKLKYPSMKQFIENNFDVEETNVNQSLSMLSGCIDMVYDEEESWDADECTQEELDGFIDQLNTKQFKEVEKFFDSMPKLSHKVKVTNPKTGVESDVVLEGLASFFQLGMDHTNLESYYKINFAMIQHHKYSLTEIENMMPWERDVYVALLKQYIEEENLKRQQSNS